MLQSKPTQADDAQATYTYDVRPGCPVCASADAATLFEAPFADGEVFAFVDKYFGHRISKERLGSGRYHVVQCGSCGLLYQKEVLSSESIVEFYDQDISSDESLQKRERAAPEYFARLVRTAAMPLRLVRKSSARDVQVLDFGMGWGHWAIAAKALGCSVFGAELSQERCKFAESHGIRVVDPFSGEFDSFFDFVNTDQVFEHLLEPREMIEGLVQVLRPGGVLKIFVPDGEATLRAMKGGNWRPSKDSVQPLEHVNGFTFSAMARLTSQVGLRPVEPAEVFGRSHVLKYPLWRRRMGPSWYFRK